MNNKLINTILTCSMCLPSCAGDTVGQTAEWDASLNLPSVDGVTPNIGVAGAFAGVLNGKLIVAGGANFPDGFPWTGATKVWHTTLYIYDFDKGKWEIMQDFLPRPAAYGVSVSLPEGILFIGGSNAEGNLNKVNYLTCENGEMKIKDDVYPDLPFPLSNTAGALVGNKIFLAGGIRGNDGDRSSDTLLMLDLENIGKGWQQLKQWPGPKLGFSVAGSADGKFYLFGGRDFGPEMETAISLAGYEYNPENDTWRVLDGEFPVMAASAATVDDKIWIFGGVEKILPTDPNHPGFPKTIRRYDPKKEVLEVIGEVEFPVTVTTTTVKVSDDHIVIASGEERPGVRTPLLLQCKIHNDK